MRFPDVALPAEYGLVASLARPPLCAVAAMRRALPLRTPSFGLHALENSGRLDAAPDTDHDLSTQEEMMDFNQQ